MSSSATVEVTEEAEIARPRAEVAAYASDWRNDPTWIRALTDVRRVDGDGPFGVGAQVERVASFLGRRMEYVNEIVEWDGDRRLAMKSVKAPFPMTVVYEWEDAGDGRTLMRIHTRGDGSGFYRVAGPLLSRAVRKGVAGDLAQLKSIMEG